MVIPAKIYAVSTMMIALVLNDCGQNEPPADAPPAPAVSGEAEMCIKGLLTSAGVECPTFKSDEGGLYSLVGDLAGVGVGEPICVCGSEVAVSTCQQGQTLEVNYLDIDCPQ